jgi:hypothetical protein
MEVVKSIIVASVRALITDVKLNSNQYGLWSMPARRCSPRSNFLTMPKCLKVRVMAWRLWKLKVKNLFSWIVTSGNTPATSSRVVSVVIMTETIGPLQASDYSTSPVRDNILDGWASACSCLTMNAHTLPLHGDGSIA